jgi:arylsulfatase A-like enzyme
MRKVAALLGVLLLLPALLYAADPNTPQPRPNVILITISTLRADHVTCLGYDRETTPNFDRFCKHAVLFRNSFAVSSWAMPNHASILTSLCPTFHGATHIEKRLDEKHLTLAKVLRQNGYFCAGFTCNPRLTEELGFAQGFDFYDDYSAEMTLRSMAFGSDNTFDLNQRRTNDLINAAAIRWLQNNTRKPFFVSVHYYDNHWDYLPCRPYSILYDPNYRGPIDGRAISKEPLFSNRPSDADVAHIIALYDGEVKRTDEDLGAFLKFLKEQDLMKNSIIIVAGDHGEQFYEHRNTSHHGIYDELIHVPMAISAPQLAHSATISDALVSQIDLMPTILDLCGLDIPDACRGKSLEPVISGYKTELNDFVITGYTGGAAPDSRAARSHRYKYVEQAGRRFIFDLKEDPAEQNPLPIDDLHGEAADEAARARKALTEIYGEN